MASQLIDSSMVTSKRPLSPRAAATAAKGWQSGGKIVFGWQKAPPELNLVSRPAGKLIASLATAGLAHLDSSRGGLFGLGDH